MKKRIFLILFLIAAGVAGWMWHTGAFDRNGNRILVSGNLELTQVDLSFKTAGRIDGADRGRRGLGEEGRLDRAAGSGAAPGPDSPRPRPGKQRAIEL